MSIRVMLPPLVVGLCICLGIISGAAGATMLTDHDVQIEQYGSGVALEDESETFLWQYESYSVQVSFASTGESIHTVCLRVDDDEENDTDEQPQPVVCEWTALGSDETATVTLSQSEWPENVSGDETLAIDIYPDRDTAGEPAQTVTIPVHIFEKDGDLAGNGLTNEREIELGTHPDMADTDGDGLTDGVEVMLGTNPRDPTTPYKISVIVVGVLTTGAFGAVLVAGRVMVGLRSLGLVGRREQSSQSATSSESIQQQFEPPIRDEARVEKLLESHDGRLKQSQIVDATDWSKSKVSRLLSSMEDDGDITRIRLGRENLVCLRGHEPPDVTPSWDKS